MNKLILSLTLGGSIFALTGCGVDRVRADNVVYQPGYSNDYVYSVGYYNNRPYWGNNYYSYDTDYNWLTNGYWASGYYNGY
jgi:hypothetical protein